MKETLDKLRLLLSEMEAIFSSDVDIHIHTRRLGDICREFLAADNRFTISHSAALTIDQVISEIMERCPEQYKANVSTALNSIKLFSGADPETGLPLQQLLIRVWALKNVYTNGEDLIFHNLNHNKETGGGCLPGIAARLVQPYTAFLFNALKDKHENNFVSEESEDDIALAIAMSLGVEESDEETQIAKALSLSSIDNVTPLRASSVNNNPSLFFSKPQQSEQDQLRWAIEQSKLVNKKLLSEATLAFLSLNGFSTQREDLDRCTSMTFKDYTPLTLAAKQLNLPVCISLLKDGASINAQNNYGNTALHMIAWFQPVVGGHSMEYAANLAQYFLNQGGDLSIANNSDQTPLFIVNNIMQNNIKIAEKFNLHGSVRNDSRTSNRY